MAEALHSESAIIIEVPEVEALVSNYRQKYDPSAPLGVPAHITLLYPFVPPTEISTETVEKLAILFAGIPAFDCQLSQIRRFTAVLYLHPKPSEKFSQLTEDILAKFPAYPPYEGDFPEVIPHLTVAQVEEAKDLESVAEEFAVAAKTQLPISFRVAEASLMQKETDRWQRIQTFALKK